MTGEDNMKKKAGREKYLYYKRQAAPYILLAPILIFVSLFLLWPMINVFLERAGI